MANKRVKQTDCYLELERLARAVSNLKLDDLQLKNFYNAFQSPLNYLDGFHKEKLAKQAEKERLAKEQAKIKSKKSNTKPKVKKVYTPDPNTKKAAYIELECAVREMASKPLETLSQSDLKTAFESPLRKIAIFKATQEDKPRSVSKKIYNKPNYLTDFMQWPIAK